MAFVNPVEAGSTRVRLGIGLVKSLFFLLFACLSSYTGCGREGTGSVQISRGGWRKWDAVCGTAGEESCRRGDL